MHAQSDVSVRLHRPARPRRTRHRTRIGHRRGLRRSAARPEYFLVDPGIFRSSHYVPVQGSHATAHGEVVVPWDKFWFKQAPKASGQHLLSTLDRHMLEVHYA